MVRQECLFFVCLVDFFSIDYLLVFFFFFLFALGLSFLLFSFCGFFFCLVRTKLPPQQKTLSPARHARYVVICHGFWSACSVFWCCCCFGCICKKCAAVLFHRFSLVSNLFCFLARTLSRGTYMCWLSSWFIFSASNISQVSFYCIGNWSNLVWPLSPPPTPPLHDNASCFSRIYTWYILLLRICISFRIRLFLATAVYGASRFPFESKVPAIFHS